MNTTERSDDLPVSGGNMFHLFALLLRWKKFIIRNTVAVTLAAIVISLLLPKWYKSVTTIIPPKDQGYASLLGMNSSTLRSLPLAGRISGLNKTMGAYNYLAILNSRTAFEAVIRKFNLIEVYGIPDTSLDLAIEALKANVLFNVQEEEEYLRIEVMDKDPVRAAGIANYFVELLNTISLELATLEARNNRDFIAKRLEGARSDLQRAENELKVYQEKHGVVLSPDLSSSSFSAVAELYGIKARKEVELGILERSVSGESDVVRSLKVEIAELDKKLAGIPGLGLQSYRLYREVAVQQKILEYLVPLYEQSKIDEQRDVPVILVLDKAVPAEKKFKPKRTLIVLSAAALSLFASLLVVFGFSYVDSLRARNVKDYEDMRRLLSESRVLGGFFKKR